MRRGTVWPPCRKFWCFKSFPDNSDLCNSSSKAKTGVFPTTCSPVLARTVPLRDLDWRSPSCQWDLYQNDPIWIFAAWQRCRPTMGLPKNEDMARDIAMQISGDRHIWQELNDIWDDFEMGSSNIFQHVPLEHLQKTMQKQSSAHVAAAVGWRNDFRPGVPFFANGY